MTYLDDFRRLTDVAWRKSFEAENGLFVAEGYLTIERAFHAGCVPRAVLTNSKFEPALRALMPGVPFEVHSDDVVEQLTGFQVHRGALASFERPSHRTLDHLPMVKRVAVLDGLVDHENVGTILRSAAALGIDAVVLTETCADPLYRRSIKTSMGAVFSVPWFRGGSASDVLNFLRIREFTQWAMTPYGSVDLDKRRDVNGPLALWLGNEGNGLSQAIMSEMDERVSISMTREVDSINVAAAAAIAFWAIGRE